MLAQVPAISLFTLLGRNAARWLTGWWRIVHFGAVVGVMAAKTKDGVRVAVTGAGPGVFRDKGIEQALASNFSADAVKGSSASAGNLNSDIHASAEYRHHLIGVMAKRAVQAAK